MKNLLLKNENIRFAVLITFSLIAICSTQEPIQNDEFNTLKEKFADQAGLIAKGNEKN